MKSAPKILVVDDHSEIRASVARYLERNAMAVSVACIIKGNNSNQSSSTAIGRYNLIIAMIFSKGNYFSTSEFLFTTLHTD